MDTAVAQLAVMNLALFGSLSGNLLNPFKLFSLPFTALNFFLQCIGGFRVFMEVIIKFLLKKVSNKSTDGFPIRRNGKGSKFGFGLRLKDRFLYLNTDSRNNASPNIACFKIFLTKVADGLNHGLTKSRLMGPPLGGVLPVDKRKVIFAVLIEVSESDLYIISLDMNKRIQGSFGNIFLE